MEAGSAEVLVTLITVVGGLVMEWIRRDIKKSVAKVEDKVEEAKVTRLESTANILEGIATIAPTQQTVVKAAAARQEAETVKGTGNGGIK